MKHFPKLPPTQVLRKRITELRSIDLRNADIDFLKSQMEPLFKGYAVCTIALAVGQVLYRGVRWEIKPKSVKDLSYPPAERIPFHQRVNRSNHPMFYSSTARETPFFELDLKPGDYVAISKWRTTRKIWVNNVGYLRKIFDGLNSKRSLPGWKHNRQPVSSPANRLVDDFFATEFAKVVLVDEEYKYRMSIAIAEKLYLGNLQLGSMPSIDAESRFGGIIYPTLAMRGNTDNIALLPEFVDRYMSLSSVEWIRIDAESQNFTYDVTVLDFSNSFGPSGEIEWKGRHSQWVLQQPGQMAIVTVENGRYVAWNEKGELLEPS